MIRRYILARAAKMKMSVRYIIIECFCLLSLQGLMFISPSISISAQHPVFPGKVISDFLINESSDSAKRSVTDYEYLSSIIEKEYSSDPANADPVLTPVLDSINELSNLGYKTEYIRWYYFYDELYRADTSIRYFYNDLEEFLNITETRTFYPDGNLKRLVRRQPVTSIYPYPYRTDTGMIDSYIEEYNYTNGFLSSKFTVSNEDSFSDSTYGFYFYDYEGKLICDSTINPNSSYYIREYQYNPDDALEYIFYRGDFIYIIDKYAYEETDTSQLTTEYRVSLDPPVEDIDEDTITVWRDITTYYETINPEGKRASLTVNEWHRGHPLFSGNQFRALYNYTSEDKISHVVYYRWQGSAEEGDWTESTRIDYTYTGEGNLLKYEKIFYDARTETWEIENRKDYYYSLVPIAILNNPAVEQLKLFPNPAKDVITIKNNTGGNSYYAIYNIQGFKLESGRLENQEIVISQLKPGMYWVEIRNGNCTSLSKFVKY